MNLSQANKDFAKQMVRDRINLTLKSLKHAERMLEHIGGSLDAKDVRQADFIYDADLREHSLVLREMIESLIRSTVSGGPLDEHFDREAT
jgi:hypothetical protein